MHKEVEDIPLPPGDSIASILPAVSICVGLACLIFVIILKLSKNSSKNPFTEEYVKSSEPVVLNQKRRDQVLKQGFRLDRVPKDLDAIIIGSGLGGLACAGCLSRAGKKVLVLEQHDRAGGCTHTYEEKGFEFDIGLHYIGQVHDGSLCHTMFDVLSDGQLVWEQLNREFDTVAIKQNDGQHKLFTYLSGKGDYEKRLIEMFPKEEKAILEFVKLMKKSSRSIFGYVTLKMMPKWLLKIVVKTGLYNRFYGSYNDLVDESVKEVLDRLTNNEELKLVLSYCFGDYGTLPSKAPFFMHGMLMYHFYHGTYYPRGGASELAFQMIPGIQRAGGAVLVRASVSRILFKENKAVGVSVNKGGVDHDIFAPVVISNAGAVNTYDKLVPPNIVSQLGVKRLRKDLDYGFAGMQVLVGLKGSKEELNLANQNYWVFNSPADPEKSLVNYLSQPREDAVNEEVPILFVSFPSTKDSTWPTRHPDKSVCVIVTFSNWEWFKEWNDDRVMKRGKVYDDLKKSFEEQVWSQVLKLFPQLKDKVEYIDTGTPITHSYYIASPRGEFYGADHTMKRFSRDNAIELRPKTTIPGLYLTGQDVMACGITGSAIGGVLTASQVLNRNLMKDLMNLSAERKKRASKKED